MDCGISEWDFWNMTFAEVSRALASYKRVKKQQEQERASFDYILADLIGQSMARIYSSSARLPEIATAYPTLFDSQAIQEHKQQKKNELSALRFKQFAAAHNMKYKGAAKVNE